MDYPLDSLIFFAKRMDRVSPLFLRLRLEVEVLKLDKFRLTTEPVARYPSLISK